MKISMPKKKKKKGKNCRRFSSSPIGRRRRLKLRSPAPVVVVVGSLFARSHICLTETPNSAKTPIFSAFMHLNSTDSFTRVQFRFRIQAFNGQIYPPPVSVDLPLLNRSHFAGIQIPICCF
ncbi:unnamed protein product [Citrullus colocynthis]|uniref:Uncharacterized protein n=1 Tax=Citrullus colocynthis TaxID=252529 RepID=A0ABP0YNM3_9ROSI